MDAMMLEPEELHRKMLELVAPHETAEDWIRRVSRTNIKLKTSLPFLEDLDNSGENRSSNSNDNNNSIFCSQGGRAARQRRIKMNAGQILEICGENDTCKTECLLQAAATCVLPHAFGGCTSKVLFIDMLSGIDPLRLVQILDSRIRGNIDPKQEAGSRILEESLKRFQLIRCYNNMDLICALKAIPHRQQKELDDNSSSTSSGYKLVLIDSISAFYWVERNLSENGSQVVSMQQDIMDFTRSKSNTVTDLLGLDPDSASYSLQNVYESIAVNLQRAAQKLRSAVIVAKNSATVLPKAWKCDYRVVLRNHERARNTFTAQWDLPKMDKVFDFTVGDSNITLVK